MAFTLRHTQPIHRPGDVRAHQPQLILERSTILNRLEPGGGAGELRAILLVAGLANGVSTEAGRKTHKVGEESAEQEWVTHVE